MWSVKMFRILSFRQHHAYKFTNNSKILHHQILNVSVEIIYILALALSITEKQYNTDVITGLLA